MAIARNGDVELYYEAFGDPADPTLLLVNGLGSQCINFPVEWCEMFVVRGYQVVRFDNRDVGLSSKLEGVDYALADMASDALAVLDAIGVGPSPRDGAVDGRDDRPAARHRPRRPAAVDDLGDVAHR